MWSHQWWTCVTPDPLPIGDTFQNTPVSVHAWACACLCVCVCMRVLICACMRLCVCCLFGSLSFIWRCVCWVLPGTRCVHPSCVEHISCPGWSSPRRRGSCYRSRCPPAVQRPPSGADCLKTQTCVSDWRGEIGYFPIKTRKWKNSVCMCVCAWVRVCASLIRHCKHQQVTICARIIWLYYLDLVLRRTPAQSSSETGRCSLPCWGDTQLQYH